MKIDFEGDESGFFEARALNKILRAAHEVEVEADMRPLLEFLQESTTMHLARPEYAALRDQHGIGSAHWPSFSATKQIWRRLLGPSLREATLSQQRSDALQRAEHSAFEALAETARVARERDQALAELARSQPASPKSDP